MNVHEAIDAAAAALDTNKRKRRAPIKVNVTRRTVLYGARSARAIEVRTNISRTGKGGPLFYRDHRIVTKDDREAR